MSARARVRFLEILAGGATIEEAAASAGRLKQTFYRLRSADATFAAEWRAAMWERAEPIEALFQRVALDGWDECEYDGEGNLVRRHHRWSSRPGEVLLKASRPELYRDNAQRVEITGLDGGPIELMPVRERLVTRIAGIAERSELSPDEAGE